MKNKEKKKNSKNRQNDDTIEKKVNTMENGKDYYEEVEEHSIENNQNNNVQKDK